MLNGEVIWQASDSTLTKELRGKSITVRKSVRVGESERERLVACSNVASSKTDNFETRFISLSLSLCFSLYKWVFIGKKRCDYIFEPYPRSIQLTWYCLALASWFSKVYLVVLVLCFRCLAVPSKLNCPVQSWLVTNCHLKSFPSLKFIFNSTEPTYVVFYQVI